MDSTEAGISLTHKEDTGISLANTETSPNVSPEVAAQRAGKVAFSNIDSTDAPDEQTLTNGITSGLEDRLRQDAATRATMSDRAFKGRVISQLIRDRGDQGISEAEVQFIKNMSSGNLHDPKTIWEGDYARQLTNTAVTTTPRNTFTEAAAQHPTGVLDAMDIAQDVLTKKEIAQKGVEVIEQRKADQGLASKTGDLLETFIPFVSWAHSDNTLATGPTSPFLKGDNLSAQLDYLYSLPPDRFQRELTSALDELWSKNGNDAEQFAHAVAAHSSSDRHLDNAFSLMDLATLLPISTIGKAAKGLKAGEEVVAEAALRGGSRVAAVSDFVKGLKDVLKASGKRTLSEGEVLNAAGDIEKGSIVQAVQNIRNRLMGAADGKLMEDMTKELPSLFNPSRIIEGYTGNFGSAALSRIVSALPASAEHLVSIMTETPNIATLNPAQITKGIMQTIETTLTAIGRQSKSMSDAVLDVVHVAPEQNAVTNLHTVTVSLGRPDGTLFQTEKLAQQYAQRQYKLLKGSYEIKPYGFGYGISVTKAIDETTPEVRQLAITTGNETPRSLANTFLGFMRTPEDNLSDFARGNRHTVVHGTQEVHRLLLEGSKRLEGLSKKERRELLKVAEFNRDFTKAGTTDRGFFYTTVQSFENGFKELNGHFPSEAQATAYFEYVQLNDIDLVINNNNLYRSKVRQGIEDIHVSRPVFDAAKKKTTSEAVEPFNGKVVDAIPERDGVNRTIAIVGENGEVKLTKGNVVSYKRIRDLQEKDGYKIVRVADPAAGAEQLTGKRTPVHYVVAKDVRTSPLEYQQIPRRPGGHVQYTQPFYTKQANLSRFGEEISYNGDTSIFAHTSEAEAKQYAKAMDDARIALKNKQRGRAQEIVEDNLPYTIDEFEALFKTKGPIAARLDLNNPIVAARSGQRTKDVADLKRLYPSAIDNTVHPDSMVASIDRQFTGERGLNLDSIVKGEGTEINPLFNLEPSKVMDPFTSISKSLGSVSRGKLLNQYKAQAAENFVEEFHTILDGPLTELRNNPYEALLNPKWANQADLSARKAAENYRRAALNLLGRPSETQQSINWVRQKVLNSVYEKFGTKGVDFVDEHLLSRVKDPTAFARNVAFHTKLGLFNPVQLFLQAQSLTHVTAVAGPRLGLKSLAGATLMRYAAMSVDEGVVRSLAKKAVTFGWDEEDFLEAYKDMRQSGIYNVANEVAMRGDHLDPKLFKSSVGKFLDKGTMFFNEGERIVRMTAYNAAYHEWREANPLAKLTNAAKAQILRRQNDLSVNMTHASNSQWQHGPLAIPTQFFGYQARLMEQFLGKRLTATEKARAFGVYSMMYGIPVAIGAPLGVMPWYEDIRQGLMERGVNINEGATNLVLDGVPSTVLKVTFGLDENYGERYGPGGLSFFSDVFSGDKTAVEIAFGASGSILGDIMDSASPVWRATVNVFSDKNDEYPLVAEDFINLFSNVSSVNNVAKSIYAINTGKYITKNQMDMGDVTTTEAVLMGVAGLTPQRFEDSFLKMDSLNDLSDAQKLAQKEVVKWMRLGFQADNSEDRKVYYTRAHAAAVAAGFRPDQYPQVFKDAVRTGDFYTTMQQRFITHAPADQYDARINAAKQGN